MRHPQVMDPSTQRLIDFVRARIIEDHEVAAQAIQGFDVEVVAATTSSVHADFVRRFDPSWVLEECALKGKMVDMEVEDAEMAEALGQGPHGFTRTRSMATAWTRHPEFDLEWMTPRQRT